MVRRSMIARWLGAGLHASASFLFEAELSGLQFLSLNHCRQVGARLHPAQQPLPRVCGAAPLSLSLCRIRVVGVVSTFEETLKAPEPLAGVIAVKDVLGFGFNFSSLSSRAIRTIFRL